MIGEAVIRYALIGGIAATGAGLGYHVVWKDPRAVAALSAEKLAHKTDTDEHNRQVAAADEAALEQSEKYRAFEQATNATITDLLKKLRGESDARRAADLRAESARVLRDDAESRYLASQASRAAADPAAAGRIDGESIAMLRELRAEVDGLAGESATAADDAAGKLNRLQDYVNDVCLRTVTASVDSVPQKDESPR